MVKRRKEDVLATSAESESQEDSSAHSTSNDNRQSLERSQLSGQLTSAITFKVIIIVLVVVTHFNLTFYNASDEGAKNYTIWLHNILANSTLSQDVKLDILKQYVSDLSVQPYFGKSMLGARKSRFLLALSISPSVDGFLPLTYDLSNRRIESIEVVTVSSATQNTTACFDSEPYYRTLALYNMVVNVIVCIVLFRKYNLSQLITFI